MVNLNHPGQAFASRILSQFHCRLEFVRWIFAFRCPCTRHIWMTPMKENSSCSSWICWRCLSRQCPAIGRSQLIADTVHIPGDTRWFQVIPGDTVVSLWTSFAAWKRKGDTVLQMTHWFIGFICKQESSFPLRTQNMEVDPFLLVCCVDLFVQETRCELQILTGCYDEKAGSFGSVSWCPRGSLGWALRIGPPIPTRDEKNATKCGRGHCTAVHLDRGKINQYNWG